MQDTAAESSVISDNLTEMAHILAKVDDPSLIENFLYGIFTKSEADEIAKRWALVKDLAGGIPQREIAKRLGLSLCKITRGSRELKKPESAFRKMLELAGVAIVEKRNRGRNWK